MTTIPIKIMMSILIHVFSFLAILDAPLAPGLPIEAPLYERYSQVEFLDISLSEAIEQSKNSKKPLFVSLYATWCAPCKVMKIKTFTNDQVAILMNEDFISIQLNGEEGDGKALMEQMSLNAFPTQLIFDPKGELIWGKSGYMGPKELIKITESIQ